MAVEIEAKVRVTDFTATREKLKQRGAVHKGNVTETNTFFDTEDRSLLAGDQGLRIRSQRSEGSAEEFIITFKGPRQTGPLKSREEVEVHVTSGKDAGALLGCLGYREMLSFQKRRESWTLGGCKVELDELPRLGTFVEVEGPTEAMIMKVREELGLGSAPLIRASYSALLMSHLQEQGATERFITFK